MTIKTLYTNVLPRLVSYLFYKFLISAKLALICTSIMQDGSYPLLNHVII